jgi:hypothetical protein
MEENIFALAIARAAEKKPHYITPANMDFIHDVLEQYFSIVGARAGSTTSELKKVSSARNGKLGGRPRKITG